MSCERCGGLMVLDSVGGDFGKDSRPRTRGVILNLTSIEEVSHA